MVEGVRCSAPLSPNRPKHARVAARWGFSAMRKRLFLAAATTSLGLAAAIARPAQAQLSHIAPSLPPESYKLIRVSAFAIIRCETGQLVAKSNRVPWLCSI